MSDKMEGFRALAYLCQVANELQDEKDVQQTLEEETQDMYKRLEEDDE